MISLLWCLLGCSPSTSSQNTPEPVSLLEKNAVRGKQEVPKQPVSDLGKEASVQQFVEDTIVYTETLICHNTESTERDTPNGWFFYAWNDARTVGVVLSVYRYRPSDIQVGEQVDIPIDGQEAFVLVELGEGIDRNFCVEKIQQIPMNTVFESTGGSVMIEHTSKGYQASLSNVSLQEQHGTLNATIDAMVIESEKVYTPTSKF